MKIHTHRLLENYRTVCNLAAQRQVFAVVKANAYGHGAALCGQILFEGGCRHFAVASLEEGITLRKVLPQGEILILGHTPPTAGDLLTDYRLSPCLFSADSAKALSRTLKAPISVHWKLDTGMHRLGFDCSESALTALRQCAALPRLNTVGIFSHWGNGESVTESAQATATFSHAVKTLQDRGMAFEQIHLQNSSALISGAGVTGTALRVGLLLYGYGSDNVRPVAHWETKIVATRTVAAGDPIGYAPATTVNRKSKIGVLPIGYADGLFRADLGRSVAVGGDTEPHFAPILAICMDMAMIDLTDLPTVEAGTPVELLGDRTDASHIARHRHTIPYEILCHMGHRAERVLFSV